MYNRKVANELFLPYLLLALCTLFLVISAPSCVEFAHRGEVKKVWKIYLRLLLAISLRGWPWALVWSSTLSYGNDDTFSFSFWFGVIFMSFWLSLWFVGLPATIANALFDVRNKKRAALVVALVGGLGAGFGSLTGLGSEHVFIVFQTLWSPS